MFRVMHLYSHVAAVARVLEVLKLGRAPPQAITPDHGPEFTGKALAQCAYGNAAACPSGIGS